MSAGLLTKHDVAARFRIAPRTVLKLAARGDLPCVRVGRHIRFEPEAVETFIAAHRHGAVPAPVSMVPPPAPSLPAPRKEWFA